MDGWSPGSAGAAAAPPGLSPPCSQNSGRPSGSPLSEPAGSSVMRGGQGDLPEGPPCLKPPAVTVKKLQKWMYKGRLLSLGMKGRARAGTPSKVAGAQAAAANRGALKVCDNHVLSVSPDQRITLTGRMICSRNANAARLGVFTNWPWVSGAKPGLGDRAKVSVMQVTAYSAFEVA